MNYLCKRLNNLAYKYPKVTNLPNHKVTLVKSFQNTGIDYTGHFFWSNIAIINVKKCVNFYIS